MTYKATFNEIKKMLKSGYEKASELYGTENDYFIDLIRLSDGKSFQYKLSGKPIEI